MVVGCEVASGLRERQLRGTRTGRLSLKGSCDIRCEVISWAKFGVFKRH